MKSLLATTALIFGLTLRILAAEPLEKAAAERPLEISGRYPHLAMFNHQGECGTGAVVPWADRLWVITYGPHLPKGSDDKLYEIDADLHRVTRSESVGGTPADRMIHKESNQLIIGPYFIDEKRNVRVIPPSKMPGRLTAAARHLTDPANKAYILDMEGMLYEVDVNTLAVTKLFDRVAPGAHAKGAYTAQGRLVIANNGDEVVNKAPPALIDSEYTKDKEAAGILAEWDGKTWKTIERRQFTEVTGPGGIKGTSIVTSPVLWAVGWDRRSLILKQLDRHFPVTGPEVDKWTTFRLPKADHSYDVRHGWYTEWPRIREASDHFLLNMHGGWFAVSTKLHDGDVKDMRAVGDYLKITGDFCDWKDRIVFGCDDATLMGFNKPPEFDTLNTLVGQSESNLWFTNWIGLHKAGRPAGDGGPWVNDAVSAEQPSDPFLIEGYSQRMLHLSHASERPITFTLEDDYHVKAGKWHQIAQITVPAKGYVWCVLPRDLQGYWMRITADHDAEGVSAVFHFGPGGGAVTDPKLFAALADIEDKGARCAGVGRPEGKDAGTASLCLQSISADGKAAGERRFERIGPVMKFASLAADDAEAKFLQEKALTKPPVFTVDDASVLVVEGQKRFRLPKSDAAYDQPSTFGWPRALREVVTERSLFNAHGTFYMLPRLDSGGVARIKPICTHNKKITDFFSWRGLLVLTGTRADATPDGHYFSTADGQAGAWFGDIDDLWKLGKPVGHGGPWKNTAVKANAASDPYLMTGYDKKSISFSHNAEKSVTFKIEVDFDTTGWHKYQTVEVPVGKTVTHVFQEGYSACWLRIVSDVDCTATAWCEYE